MASRLSIERRNYARGRVGIQKSMLVATHPAKELLSQLPVPRTQVLKKNRSVAPVPYALCAISLGVNGYYAGRSQNIVMLDVNLVSPGTQPTLAR